MLELYPQLDKSVWIRMVDTSQQQTSVQLLLFLQQLLQMLTSQVLLTLICYTSTTHPPQPLVHLILLFNTKRAIQISQLLEDDWVSGTHEVSGFNFWLSCKHDSGRKKIFQFSESNHLFIWATLILKYLETKYGHVDKETTKYYAFTEDAIAPKNSIEVVYEGLKASS